MEVVVDRCAGLDVHKDTVTACVRTPGAGRARRQQVREFRTFTGTLRALRTWLVEEGVAEVAMEATGVYWKPVWHVLSEEPGLKLLLVNAQHVKNVPGRKTDVNDAAWLAQLCECGLLRGSFVPDAVIGQLRDLTRYRKKLIEERGRETQRIQKLLEDAGIKLDSVVSDVLGVSGRQMLDALLAGANDPAVLAELAHGRMRTKIPLLRQALEGRFGAHHAVLLRLHLRHVDDLTGMLDQLDAEVERVMAPFAEHVTRLRTIPGVGQRTAEVIIAEIGVDMTRFPTAGHLASWAGMCPGNHESAHKRKSGHARKGDAALRTALCEAAWCASRTRDTYLAAQYRQFLRRFGKRAAPKAAFAVGHTILVIAWHLLSRSCDYQDLGGNYFDRRADSQARQRYLIRQLEALGNKVTVQPAA